MDVMDGVEGWRDGEREEWDGMGRNGWLDKRMDEWMDG